MKIDELQIENASDVLRFYQSAFPNRNDVVSRFNHELLNPYFADNTGPPGIIGVDNEEIAGQLLIQPCACVYNGRMDRCYVGYDLFVSKRYRRAGVGGLLVFDAIRRLSPYFTIGLSDTTRRMLLGLNLTAIGELHKYLWLRKSLTTGSSLIRGMAGCAVTWDPGRLPRVLRSGSEGEIRQGVMPEFDVGTGAEDVLSFARTTEFIRWRFIDHPNRYSLFSFDSSPSSFFVVRMCLWHGLRVLTLVDYRAPRHRPELLTTIAAAERARIVSSIRSMRNISLSRKSLPVPGRL
jgi:GNAT superfamily N-acetyltransferase